MVSFRIFFRLARADIFFARRKCENFRTAKTHQESFLLLMKNIFAGVLESRTQNNHETISAPDRPGVDQMPRLGRMPMIDVLRIRESSASKCGAVHRAGVAHGNFAVRVANAEILQSREDANENRRSEAASVKSCVHSADGDVRLVAVDVGMRKSCGRARFPQDKNTTR